MSCLLSSRKVEASKADMVAASIGHLFSPAITKYGCLSVLFGSFASRHKMDVYPSLNSTRHILFLSFFFSPLRSILFEFLRDAHRKECGGAKKTKTLHSFEKKTFKKLYDRLIKHVSTTTSKYGPWKTSREQKNE